MKKRILSLALTLCMLISIFSTFSISVSAASTPSDWAVSEVNAATGEGLVTAKVTKDYQKAITREEFCELVVKLYEKLTSEKATIGNNPFSDTDNTEILKAYSLGIVNGVSETEFAPDNTITRQEMCVMIVRAIESILGDEFILKYDFFKFEDGRDIADWAFEQVYYAYEKGIVKGVGDNKINPLGTATCEQAIIMIYRLYENIDACKETIPQKVIDRYENYTYVNETFKRIEKKYTDENGYVLPENIETVLNEVYTSAQNMIENGDIQSAKLSKEYFNVYIVLKDGTGYIYSPSIEGLLNYSPKTTEIVEFDNFPPFDVLTRQKAGNTAANKFDFCDYSYIDTNEKSLVAVKVKLSSLDPQKKCIIYWHGHGSVGYYSAPLSFHEFETIGPVQLYSGVTLGIPEVASLESQYKFQGDIDERRVVLFKDAYGLTPLFFDTYLSNVKSGLFFAGACQSLCDKGELAKVFINKGFDTYIGSNMSVSTQYVNNFMDSFGAYLCEYVDESKSETITAEETIQKTKEKHGASDWNVMTDVYNFFTGETLSGAEFFLVGDSDFRLIESKTIQSSHIAKYNGITYSTRDVPGMVKIPIQPAKYDYIWEIAFYEDKVYYSCKESGSSDYKSAIYSCNLDGSDLKLLYEGTYESTSFAITGNKLYPSGTSSYGKKYVDIKTNVLTEPNYVIPDDYNVFYVSGDYAYCSTYSKKSKYSIYKINVATGEKKSITSNLSKTYECISSSNGDVYYGNKNCLYYIEDGESKLIHQFDRNISLVAVIDDIVYYESYQGNTSSLYYYNLKTYSDNIIDSHPSAGGGIYFNW